MITLFLIIKLTGHSVQFGPIAVTALIQLVLLSLNIFKFAVFIYILLSWIAPGTHNPATAFIAMLADPVLRPFRNMIPSLGGLDISPDSFQEGILKPSGMVKIYWRIKTWQNITTNYVW